MTIERVMRNETPAQEIERFEKYREGRSWWDYQEFSLGKRLTGKVKEFAYFYANSDWDDPGMAYQEWATVTVNAKPHNTYNLGSQC